MVCHSPSLRRSNAVRASILDVALQLGLKQGSRIANWMFNDPSQDPGEEDSPLCRMSPAPDPDDEELWELLHYYVTDGKLGDESTMSPVDRSEAVQAIGELLRKSARKKRAMGHSRTVSTPTFPAFDLRAGMGAGHGSPMLLSPAPWGLRALGAYGVNLPRTPVTPSDTITVILPVPPAAKKTYAALADMSFSGTSTNTRSHEKLSLNTTPTIIETAAPYPTSPPPYSPPRSTADAASLYVSSSTSNERPQSRNSNTPRRLPPVPEVRTPTPSSPRLSHISTNPSATVGATLTSTAAASHPLQRGSSVGTLPSDTQRVRAIMPRYSNAESPMVRSNTVTGIPSSQSGTAVTAPLKIRKHAKSLSSSLAPARQTATDGGVMSGVRPLPPRSSPSPDPHANLTPTKPLASRDSQVDVARLPHDQPQQGRPSPFPAQLAGEKKVLSVPFENWI